MFTDTSIDTLNPQTAESTFFVAAVAISIAQTFFYLFAGNGDAAFRTPTIAFCHFKNFFTPSAICAMPRKYGFMYSFAASVFISS